MMARWHSIVIKTLSGNTLDIIGITHNVEIFLDIYQEFASSVIHLYDGNNILSNYKISGGEECVIIFSDGYNQPVKMSFFIYLIDEPEYVTYTGTKYVLHGVSPEYFASSTGNEEQGRYDLPSHQAVEYILKRLHDKSGCEQPFKFKSKPAPKYSDYSNTMLPFDLLRKITHTIHDQTLSPWLLFQDCYSYNFLSLSDIMKMNCYANVVFQDKLSPSNVNSSDIVAYQWERMSNDNLLVNNVNQKIGHKRNNLDLNAKTYETNEFDVKKRFSNIPSLEKYPAIHSSVNYDKNTAMFISSDPLHIETSSVRNSAFRALSEVVYECELPINTQMFSKKVKVDIPSKESYKKTYKTEKDMSGLFLVTACKISLGNLPQDFKMKCEFSKDSRPVQI
jgi:hypothetical protein